MLELGKPSIDAYNMRDMQINVFRQKKLLIKTPNRNFQVIYNPVVNLEHHLGVSLCIYGTKNKYDVRKYVENPLH